VRGRGYWADGPPREGTADTTDFSKETTAQILTVCSHTLCTHTAAQELGGPEGLPLELLESLLVQRTGEELAGEEVPLVRHSVPRRQVALVAVVARELADGGGRVPVLKLSKLLVGGPSDFYTGGQGIDSLPSPAASGLANVFSNMMTLMKPKQ
jgi:hypothetical protein